MIREFAEESFRREQQGLKQQRREQSREQQRRAQTGTRRASQNQNNGSGSLRDHIEAKDGRVGEVG